MIGVKIGDRLANGAIVLDVYHDTQGYTRVVAHWEHNSMPFVYWTIDSELNANWGHYFKTLIEVARYAHERAKQDRGIAYQIGR